jgi:hypothetical protein
MDEIYELLADLATEPFLSTPETRDRAAAIAGALAGLDPDKAKSLPSGELSALMELANAR